MTSALRNACFRGILLKKSDRQLDRNFLASYVRF
jgi:hypothetical protein